MLEREKVNQYISNDKISNMRKIPFCSVGETQGLLPVMEIEEMYVHREKEYRIRHPVIGICGEPYFRQRKLRHDSESGYFLGGNNMIIKIAVPNQFKLKVMSDFRTLLFPEKQDVHYIGGSEVLPAPLEVEEERVAIEGLGSEEDEQAKKMLIEHNLRLVVYIAKKFDNTGVGVEDLISIGTIGLNQSHQYF